MQLIEPIVMESDARVQGVMESQSVLYKEICRLCTALEPFEGEQEPPKFQEYISKLTTIRERVGGIQSVMAKVVLRLRGIQASVAPGGRLHYLAEKGRQAAERGEVGLG